MYQDKKKPIFARNFIGNPSGKIRTKIRSNENKFALLFCTGKAYFQELEGTPRVCGSPLKNLKIRFFHANKIDAVFFIKKASPDDAQQSFHDFGIVQPAPLLVAGGLFRFVLSRWYNQVTECPVIHHPKNGWCNCRWSPSDLEQNT